MEPEHVDCCSLKRKLSEGQLQNSQNSACTERPSRFNTAECSHECNYSTDDESDGCACGDENCTGKSCAAGAWRNGLLHGPAFSIKHYCSIATGERKVTVSKGNNPRPVAKIIFTLDASRQWAHVKSVSVSEAHRGRGLGPLLFTELFAFAARLGIPEVRLEAE
eukprot:10699-Heterococcus_DN1.PRE.1